MGPRGLFKGFAMPPTPFLGSGASFQGPGPLPMASARRAIGISLIESFWHALGVGIQQFCDFVDFGHVGFLEDLDCLGELLYGPPGPTI